LGQHTLQKNNAKYRKLTNEIYNVICVESRSNNEKKFTLTGIGP